MTPQQAAEMYEDLVCRTLDAEEEIDRSHRIDIMREILEKHDQEAVKLHGSATEKRFRVPDLLKLLEDYSRAELTLSRLGEILDQSPPVLRAVFVRAAKVMAGNEQPTLTCALCDAEGDEAGVCMRSSYGELLCSTCVIKRDGE